VPTIHGATRRGVRVLPGLTVGQGLGLAATAALAGLLARGAGPAVLRVVAALGAAAAGGAYALARWPPGPAGERLPVWLPRLARHLLGPRLRAGTAVEGWDGLEALGDAALRCHGTWAAVLELGGADFGLRGPGAAEAAQSAFRELLHAAGSPLQIVGLSRALCAEDRPADWEPGRAPAALTGVAAAYAEHWTELVRSGRGVLRRTLLVLTAGPDEGAGERLRTLAAAATGSAQRLGLPARRLRGAELRVLLRACGGGADSRCGAPDADSWRVRGRA